MSSFPSEFAHLVDYGPDLILTSSCGEIKRLVMGLDRFNKTPCGFCFVEYYTHQDALDCLKYIGGTKLDERIIRADLDPGFEEGRQFGYVVFKMRFTDWEWLTLLVDEASQVDKCATNTARNTTRAVVDMVAPMTSSASAKKMNTAPGGRSGHNETVLAQPSNGVIPLVVNQLAKTGNVYSSNTLFTIVS